MGLEDECHIQQYDHIDMVWSCSHVKSIVWTKPHSALWTHWYGLVMFSCEAIVWTPALRHNTSFFINFLVSPFTSFSALFYRYSLLLSFLFCYVIVLLPCIFQCYKMSVPQDSFRRFHCCYYGIYYHTILIQVIEKCCLNYWKQIQFIIENALNKKVYTP